MSGDLYRKKVVSKYNSSTRVSGSTDPVRQALGYWYFNIYNDGFYSSYSHSMKLRDGVGGDGLDRTIATELYESTDADTFELDGSSYLTKEAELDFMGYNIQTVPNLVVPGPTYPAAEIPGFIKYVDYNPDLVSYRTAGVPRVSYPIRLIGDSDKIVNDSHWKKILLGGTFNTSSYSAIYNRTVHNTCRFATDFGYDKKYIKQQENAGSLSTVFNPIEISYHYSSHSPEYQEFSNNTHERLLPNFNYLGIYAKDIYAGTTTYTVDPQHFFPEPLHKQYSVDTTSVNFDTIEKLFDNVDSVDSMSALTRDVPAKVFEGLGVPTYGATTSKYFAYHYNINKYLTGSFASNLEKLTDDEIQYIHTANETVYFLSDAVAKLQDNNFRHDTRAAGRPTSPAQNFPMCVKLSIPRKNESADGDSDGHIAKYSGILSGIQDVYYVPGVAEDGVTAIEVEYPNQTFENSGSLQEEVMSYIRGTFTLNSQMCGAVESMPFWRFTQYYKFDPREYESMSEEGGMGTRMSYSSKQSTSNRNQQIFMFDIPQMLLKIANNNTISTDNLVITEYVEHSTFMRNANSLYRYQKSYPAISALEKTLNRMTDKLKANFPPYDGSSTASPNNYYDILRRLDLRGGTTNDSDHYSHELFCYRIVKKGGNPVGADSSTETLQTFMVFNDGTLKSVDPAGASIDKYDDITIYDTQVKYGKDYTYEIYAYYIVPGYRYRYNNLRVSNLIGTIDEGRDPIDGTHKKEIRPGGGIYGEYAQSNCLEFRDPVTDLPLPQLISNETNLKFYTRKVVYEPDRFFTNTSRFTYWSYDVSTTKSPTELMVNTGDQFKNAPLEIQAFIWYLFSKIYLEGDINTRESLSRALNYDFSHTWYMYGATTIMYYISHGRYPYDYIDRSSTGYLTVYQDEDHTISNRYAPEMAIGFHMEEEMRTDTMEAHESYFGFAEGEAFKNFIAYNFEMFFVGLEAYAGTNPTYFIDKYYEFCEMYPVYVLPDSYESLLAGLDTYDISGTFFNSFSSLGETAEDSALAQMFTKFFTKLSWGKEIELRKNVAASGDLVKEELSDIFSFSGGTDVQDSLSATNAQIKSQYRFLADLNIEIEPTLKMVQVPMATKTIRLLDHPPAACDVTPYFKKDDSQTIGFFINEEAFSQFSTKYDKLNTKVNTYPTPISSYESEIRTAYMNSNDLLPNEYLTKQSVSNVQSLLVYRLSHKPTSLTDFDENLIATKALNFNVDDSYSTTSCFYEEKITTNKKMYYLFKFINKNGIIGHTSPIQEVELVDDGGYKYLNVNTYSENDIIPVQEKVISKQFNRLMQIKLQPSQTLLDYSNVDFSENPQSQKTNIIVGGSDSVWGKKYKFRLTSKKTGRKLDLNVFYDLEK